MNDDECVRFLQRALPRLRLRWAGYRRVRRQVCRRIRRRLDALSLPDTDAYWRHLERHPGEWDALDALCTVTVSRFYRDRAVFALLAGEVLPELARAARGRGQDVLRIWSAGCASGEEPYSFSLLWEFALAPRFPGLEAAILATDNDPALLVRAARGCYQPGSLRELPPEWREQGFDRRGDEHWVRPALRARVRFARHDVRGPAPPGPFDLVACRNLAFTYYETDLQRMVVEHLRGALREGGALLLGAREALPEGTPGFRGVASMHGLYLKSG